MSGEKKRPRITKAMLTTLRRFGACSEGMRRLARFKYVDSALLRLPSDDVEWLCASTSGLCVSTSGLECFCDGSKPIGERVAAVLAAMKTICKEWLGVVTDTPDRRPGVRPRVESTLVQIVNPHDDGFVAIAVADDGSMRIVLHSGRIVIDDRRGRDD